MRKKRPMLAVLTAGVGLLLGGAVIILHMWGDGSSGSTDLPSAPTEPHTNLGDAVHDSTTDQPTEPAAPDTHHLNYLRLVDFPRDASLRLFSVALTVPIASADQVLEYTLHQLQDAPVALDVGETAPASLPFTLLHRSMEEPIYLGVARPVVESGGRFWDLVVPSGELVVTVRTCDHPVDLRLWVEASVMDGDPQPLYPSIEWGSVDQRVEAGTSISISLFPWRYRLGALFGRRSSLPVDPGRPSEIQGDVIVEPAIVDLRGATKLTVDVDIRHVETWVRVDTLGRAVTTAYCWDGAAVVRFPLDDDEVGIFDRLWKMQAPAVDVDDGEASVLKRLQDDWFFQRVWRFDVRGGLWYREPSPFDDPPVIALEFQDGGVSVFRQTTKLPDGAEEIVCRGSPSDGAVIEVALRPLPHTEEVSMLCEVVIPSGEPHRWFWYYKEVLLAPDATTSVRIPYDAELWVTAIHVASPAETDAKYQVAAPAEYVSRGGTFLGPPLKGGQRVTVELVEKPQ